MKKKVEKYCGECCWFYAEDTYGYGCCPYQFADIKRCDQKCNKPNEYVSEKEMRHYMAVMLQSYRRHVSFYGRPDELFKAIDFAYRYMKIFSNL